MLVRAVGARTVLAALFALAFVLAPPSPARAHPHVWIDMQSELQFDDQGRVTAIGITWTFDEFYSAFAVEGAARTDNGYDEELLAGLAEVNLQNLAEWNYFTEVTAGGKTVALDTARDGKSTWDDEAGRLTLAFVVPLRKPVIPSATEMLKLRIYDPSYYISIDYVKDEPVRMTGKVPQGCGVNSETPNVENVWIGLPETAFTDPNSRLGANFATIVTLTCPPSS